MYECWLSGLMDAFMDQCASQVLYTVIDGTTDDRQTNDLDKLLN